MKIKIKATLSLLSSLILAAANAYGLTSAQLETSIRTTTTGCPNFTITPPSVGSGVVVNAASFGVSTNNTGAVNYTDFVNAINYCKTNSVYKLIVNPGTYRIGNYGSSYTAILYFNGFHDFIFDGQGSTFLFQAKSYFIEPANCSRVVFQNMTLNWDWSLEPVQSLTQIQDIDPSGNYIDLVYPYETNPSATANVYEIDEVDGLNYDCAHSGTGVIGAWQLDLTKTTREAGSVVRFFSKTNAVGQNWFHENGAAVGQYSIIRHYSYEHHGVYVNGNNNITFTNMTMYSTLGMGYLFVNNQYYQIINSSIVREPGSIYHFSSAADGLHVANSFGYFNIQNVEISHAGDDSINIHDTLSQGVSVLGTNKLIALNAISWRNPYNPGDVVELRNRDLSPAGWSSTVTASSYNDSLSQCTITFANNLPGGLDTSSILFNHHYNSGNYAITGCYIHENKGRGAVVYTPNATIENNDFMYNYNPGIFISCLATNYGEGFNPTNVVLLNNLFEGNDIERDTYPYTPNNVVITGVTTPVGIVNYPICRNIIVAQNVIKDCPYAAIQVTSATNVLVADNIIESPNQWNNLSQVQGCVMIQDCGGVVFNNNDLILDAGVTSYKTNVYTATTTNVFVAPFVATTLPSTWASWDVGTVGLGGTAAYTNGVFTVQGSGSDIWSTSDSFQYVWQPWNGDGQIVAHVNTVQNTDPWAKAGIMFRESLDPAAPNTIIFVSPSSGISMQGRTSTGGSTATVNTITGITAPRWISLVRQGTTLSGYESADGLNWTLVGVQTNVMTSGVCVGLAVTSKTNSVLNTSTFDHVTVNGAWLHQDVGSVGMAGSSTVNYSSGVCTVVGSGADIWGNGDEFQFLYQGASGDRAIVARVTGVQNTDPWAKAAVMIRETTATNSRNTTLFLSPGNGVSLQGRTNTGGLSATVNTVAGLTAPQWLRLVRSSSLMNAYYSSNGTNWTWVGSQTNSMATTYDIGLAVTSKSNTETNTSTFDNVGVSDAWTSQDIGSVGVAGMTEANDATGTFTVSGAGADIWGNSDALQYYNQGFYGNGSIVARVVNTGDVNPWDKAGVMIRDTLSAGAENALLFVTPTNGISFQGRASTGGTTSTFASVTTVSTPCWLKLTRSGSSITAYWSSNGTTWNTINTQTISMSTNAWIGLAVGSKDNILLNTATFDNVTVTPSP